MSFATRSLTVLLLLLVIPACGQVDLSCEPAGEVTPICGVQMPEDLAPLPAGGGILVAEYGDGGKRSGELKWFQPQADNEFVSVVSSDNIGVGAANLNWGEADCPVPDLLSPHGIHLAQRGDKLQLLVVNHSSVEQVLFYEVQPSVDTNVAPVLSWRGCVSFPDNAVLNDVVALPGDGFAVTHMYDRESEIVAMIKSSLGMNNGHVWLWYPDSGLQVMANTTAKMPNGIEVAADGRSIWVNNYIEQELRQYDLATQALLATIEIPNIDNSAWLSDGRLLLASHDSPLTMMSCFGLLEGSCGAAYTLVAVDTDSGDTEVIFHSDKGGPFGPATVAIEYQGKLYAGSFSGDRMAEIAR